MGRRGRQNPAGALLAKYVSQHVINSGKPSPVFAETHTNGASARTVDFTACGYLPVPVRANLYRDQIDFRQGNQSAFYLKDIQYRQVFTRLCMTPSSQR